MFVILLFKYSDVREALVEFQNVCLLVVVLPASVHVVQEESVPSSCVVFVVVVRVDVKWSGAVCRHDLRLVRHEVVLVDVADPLDCSVDFVRRSLPCESPVCLGLPVLELGVEILQELHAGRGGNVKGRQYEVEPLLFLLKFCLKSGLALFLDLGQGLESVAGVLGGACHLVALRAVAHLAMPALLAGVSCVGRVCHVNYSPDLNCG